jgi:hypothetical protein
MKALPRLNPSSENLGFFRFSEMDQGVEVNSARLSVTKRIITLSISANGIRCEDLPKPHLSLFLLPFDLLGGGVSKVPGFVRLGVEAFLDFGIADALFLHTGG